MIHDIILLGIQGSGKGTQAKRFIAEHDVAYFEMGQQLRNTDRTTELGAEVHTYLDDGKLVPVSIVLQLLTEFYTQLDDEKLVILDGFPRSVEQLEGYKALTENAGRTPHCIEFMLDKDEAIARIQGRAKEQGRVDDMDLESILSRMQWTEEETGPVLDWFKTEDLYSTVDAAGEMDEVYDLFHAVVHELVD
jgi:adenylate kinase